MDKREAIMQAALDLFAERGFYGTPVPLIAEKANVGAGTIYRYFNDKEHLVNELYRHWKAELSRAIERDLSLDMPLRAMFGKIGRRWIDFAMNNRSAYTFLVAHHHAPYLDEETVKMTEAMHLKYREIFELGRKEQIFKDVQPEVILAVVSGIIDQIMKEYWSGRFDLTDELIGMIEEICWQAVRR